MKRITPGRVAVLTAIAACMLLQSELDAQKRPVRCAGGHRIRIVDLNISPDPIARGQKIERLRAVAQVDGNGECETLFELTEDPGVEIVAQAVKKILKPGKNHIEFRPMGPYRFRAREHCFQVIADIGGTRRAVDAARRFCARETSRQSRRWTMN
jgi:hypothetical protein